MGTHVDLKAGDGGLTELTKLTGFTQGQALFYRVFDKSPVAGDLAAKGAKTGLVLNLPAAVAQSMDFAKGEAVQWTVADKGHLILSRDVMPLTRWLFKKTPGFFPNSSR